MMESLASYAHPTLFYLFSVVLLGAALGVVFSRNPVHSVMFLVLTFFQAQFCGCSRRPNFWPSCWCSFTSAR